MAYTGRAYPGLSPIRVEKVSAVRICPFEIAGELWGGDKKLFPDAPPSDTIEGVDKIDREEAVTCFICPPAYYI